MHWYAEETKQAMHYTLSGNNFVIDLVYLKEVKEVSGAAAGETQSGRSSMVQVGKEKLEEVSKILDTITLSLVDESWSRYFHCFSSRLLMYLKKKKFLLAGELIGNMCLYDNEEAESATSFSSAVRAMSKAEAKLEPVLGAAVSEYVSYSFEEHQVCLWWTLPSGGWGSRPICAPFTDATFAVVRVGSSLLKVTEALPTVEALRSSPILWSMLAESNLMPLSLRVPPTSSRAIDRLEFVLERAGQVAVSGYITAAGQLYIDNQIDQTKTLLLQRAQSLEHAFDAIFSDSAVLANVP